MFVCAYVCVYTHAFICMGEKVLGRHTSITKESLSHVLDLLHKAQDSWAVLSSLILEEFFSKRLACHLAGTLKKRKLGCSVGKGDPVTFKIF